MHLLACELIDNAQFFGGNSNPPFRGKIVSSIFLPSVSFVDLTDITFIGLDYEHSWNTAVALGSVSRLISGVTRNHCAPMSRKNSL